MASTLHIRCIYGIFGRKITKYTVIYGVYIRFWPTLGTGHVPRQWEVWEWLTCQHSFSFVELAMLNRRQNRQSVLVKMKGILRATGLHTHTRSHAHAHAHTHKHTHTHSQGEIVGAAETAASVAEVLQQRCHQSDLQLQQVCWTHARTHTRLKRNPTQ